jgi:Hemerythrin HHE cation binding domain.
MEAEKLIPIKRNEALVKFSKEHHYGLLLGWEIKQGLQNNIQVKRIANYILFFFDNDLESHFAEEERILFSKLSDDDFLKQQAINEHRSIYRLIKNIRSGKYTTETLVSFADELESHIRFEERVLFNHIQEQLSEDELLEVLLNHKHKTVDIDGDWEDRFWEG